MPMPVEPFYQRCYAPRFHSRSHSAGSGPEVVGPHHRLFFEEDVVFKLLCQQEKVGSLMGRGGHVLQSIQNETDASIKVADVMPQTDEWVVRHVRSQSRDTPKHRMLLCLCTPDLQRSDLNLVLQSLLGLLYIHSRLVVY